jgi:hypothetical protein
MPPKVVHHMSASSTGMEALVLFSPPLKVGHPRADIIAA